MKRTVGIIAAFLLLALSGSLVAQETDAEWFWNKPIESIRWDGLKKANKSELDSLLRNYVGSPFTPELWLEMQAKLYELDWFETIEPQAIALYETKLRLALLFVVKEKPSVLSVRLSGNSGLRSSEILAVISSKAGDIYNESKANLDDMAIKKLYLEKGYPDAEVSHQIVPSSDPSLLVLNFDLKEGGQVALRSIRFSGNTSISERTLKSQMSLKEAALFQSGAFQEAKLNESKLAIIDYYQSKGYVDAKIIDVFKEYEKEDDSGKNWLILTIAVSEGKQWKFGGISFNGNDIFEESRLRDLVSLKEGAILNYKRLVQDKQKIDNLYYESGYIYNQIAMTENRNEAEGSIAYRISIVERDRAHIESLSFKGNEKTKNFVLAREVPLEEGDIFSQTKIIEGLRNLYNLQYFSNVEPQFYQGSAENLMDLVVNVEEMSTADIQFGVTLTGLGSKDSFPVSGFVKWNDRNLGGMGRNLAVNLTLSPSEQKIETSFSEGWLFGKRISRGFSFGFSHSSETTGQDIIAPIFTDEDIPDPFTSLVSGSGQWSGSLSSIPDQYLMPYENWDFSLGFNLGYTQKYRFGDLGVAGGVSSGLDMIQYDDTKYRPYEAEFRSTNGQWLLTDRIYGRFYLNNLDYWYNPSSGYYAGQRLTLTGVLPIERQHYLKSETKLEAYHTLFKIPLSETWNFKWVLMAHTGFQSLFGQPWYPFKVTKDWISLDGTFNARGWDELYGAKGVMLWENSLELRMPIVEQMLWLDLFVDAGAMKTETGMLDMTLATPAAIPNTGFSSLGWSNMAFSTGAGLRFTIPQFPFRFYFVKRFSFDGVNIDWKTKGWDFDFVLSITQPLY